MARVTRPGAAKPLPCNGMRGERVRYDCRSRNSVRNRERPRAFGAASGIGEACRLTRPPRPLGGRSRWILPFVKGRNKGRRLSPFMPTYAVGDRVRMPFRGADVNRRRLLPFGCSPRGVRGWPPARAPRVGDADQLLQEVVAVHVRQCVKGKLYGADREHRRRGRRDAAGGLPADVGEGDNP